MKLLTQFPTLYSNLKRPSEKIWITGLIPPALVILGAALAIYADSPYLLIPFLGIMALASFAALEFALYILIGFLPFSFRFIFTYGTEIQVPTEPLLAIMSVALFLRWIILKKSNQVIIKFPFRFPILVYSLSLLLSIINSTHKYSSAKGSLRAIVYIMLSVLVFNLITDRKKLIRLFVVGVIPATVAVLWTAIFLWDRLDMWQWSSAYEGLPFTSYSHYGAFVAVILLILLSRAIFDRGVYDKVIWNILLGIFIVAMGLSFSRGAWLSFILALGFLFSQKSSGIKHKKIIIVIGALVLLVVLLSIPYAANIILSRTRTITNFGYGANRERILRWGTALIMFLKHPVIGCGYGSFAFTYVNDPTAIGIHLIKYKMGAHNEYLQALAETGIIGFSAWMWIIVSFFVYGFRLLRKLKSEDWFYRSIIIGVMSALLSLLLHFVVNNMIQADIVGIPFWLLIGILPAIGNIVGKSNT